MKKVLFLALSAFAINASASELNYTCDVTKVLNGNVFEEGLGETGSPNADEDSQSVDIELGARLQSMSIGQHTFSSDKAGVSISLKNSERETSITATVKNSQVVQIKIFSPSKRGIILQKDAGVSRYQVVAEIDCNDYRRVKAAMLAGKVASAGMLKSNLPQEVVRKMNEIDVPFEMGDGYYDLKYEKYYQLSIAGKVVGYLLESYLSYTEGEDVVANTYFLANGVRFSGPNN